MAHASLLFFFASNETKATASPSPLLPLLLAIPLANPQLRASISSITVVFTVSADCSPPTMQSTITRIDSILSFVSPPPPHPRKGGSYYLSRLTSILLVINHCFLINLWKRCSTVCWKCNSANRLLLIGSFVLENDSKWIYIYICTFLLIEFGSLEMFCFRIQLIRNYR